MNIACYSGAIWRALYAITITIFIARFVFQLFHISSSWPVRQRNQYLSINAVQQDKAWPTNSGIADCLPVVPARASVKFRSAELG